jgi:membrane associated rhomboid family serine protease
LHIFGDNVEDRMGHARYLVFYVLSGVAGGLVQVLTGPTSTIPMIGASGAIAGVLGAYIMLFPRARVLTFVPVFFLPWMVEIPAVIYLGVWFFSQFSNGMMGMSMSVSGGIAYWAHVGGFASGFVLVRSFSRHTQTVRTQPPAGNRYQSG